MEFKGVKTREEYAAMRQDAINKGLDFVRNTSLSKQFDRKDIALLEHIFGHIFSLSYQAGRYNEHEYWLKKVASEHEQSPSGVIDISRMFPTVNLTEI